MPVKKMTVDVTRIDVDAGSYFLLIKIGADRCCGRCDRIRS